MAILRFRRRCADMMFLIINILPSLLFAHPVILKISAGTYSVTVGLGENNKSSFGYGFERCICTDLILESCTMPSKQLDNYPDLPKQAMPAENSDNYRKNARFFTCQFMSPGVICFKETPSSCPSTHCTINIIIQCSLRKTVVLAWERTQTPRILMFSDVVVIDCCIISSTSKEETTKMTTQPSKISSSIHSMMEMTAIDTTQLSTISSSTYAMTEVKAPSTTTKSRTPTTTHPITESKPTNFTEGSSTTTAGTRLTKSPAPDIITIENTHSVTPKQQNGTSNEETGNSDASSQISSQHIGITVGIAIAAILVTIAVMIICWWLKTRRENNRRKEETDRTIVLGNVKNTQVDHSMYHANEGDNKTAGDIFLVSPLFQSDEGDNHRIQTAGDYTYIEINPATTSRSSAAQTFPSDHIEEINPIYATAHTVTETRDSGYSHLGANKSRQENSYNFLDQRNGSLTI